MFMSIPFVTGWLMIAFAMNIEMVDAGRVLTGRFQILQKNRSHHTIFTSSFFVFITGFCAGSASMAVPVFLGEIAEDNIRGFLGSSFQFQVAAGNLFVYVLGKFINWQWLALSCSIVILAGLILMAIVPPSPRFLLSKGRFYDAARALVWLRGAVAVDQIENELNSVCIINLPSFCSYYQNAFLKFIFRSRNALTRQTKSDGISMIYLNFPFYAHFSSASSFYSFNK